MHTSQPQEEAVVETQVVTEPEPEQEPEYTAVVYQEQLGDTAEQFYTETIVTQDTGHMGSQEVSFVSVQPLLHIVLKATYLLPIPNLKKTGITFKQVFSYFSGNLLKALYSKAVAVMAFQ